MLKSKLFVISSRTGCLLPVLIIFNLFFGWIFFRPTHWLLIEALLILLFILNSIFLTRKILSASPRHDDAIDVEGEVLDKK